MLGALVEGASCREDADAKDDYVETLQALGTFGERDDRAIVRKVDEPHLDGVDIKSASLGQLGQSGLALFSLRTARISLLSPRSRS